MSLTYDQFNSAEEAYDKLKNRLIQLLGFNPSVNDHYGITHLYNKEIFVQTSDEEIMDIHNRFLRWQESILAIFAENGVVLDGNQVKELFRVSGMCGTMYFLEVPVDIDGGTEPYRPAILSYLENWKS